MRVLPLSFLLITVSLLIPIPRLSAGPGSPYPPHDRGVAGIYWQGNHISNIHYNMGQYVSHLLTFQAGLEWPAGSGKTAVFTAGYWLIAGKVNGQNQIRSASTEFVSEFQPGNIDIDGNPTDPEDPIHRIYTVTSESTPDDPDWQSWPAALGAPWVDEDGDGTWDPNMDRPLLLGDYHQWYVMNDLNQSLHYALFATEPLGVETQVSLFGFDAPGGIGDLLFLRHLIINKGSNELDSLYLGNWMDSDVGGANDDLVGFYTDLGLAYAYNGGFDLKYGPNPPGVGLKFLQTPMMSSPGDTARMFGRYIPDWLNLPPVAFIRFASGTPVNMSDPETAHEAYHYLNGLDRFGAPIINPVTGSVTTYMYSGNPLTGEGWVDSNPTDRRMLFSVGPFSMAPGDSQEVISALVIAQSGDALSSLDRLWKMVPAVDSIYGQSFQIEPVTDQFFLSGTFSQIVEEDLYADEQVNPGERVVLEIEAITTPPAVSLQMEYTFASDGGWLPGMSVAYPDIGETGSPATYNLEVELEPVFPGIGFNLVLEGFDPLGGSWMAGAAAAEPVTLYIPVSRPSAPPLPFTTDHVAGIGDARVMYQRIDPTQYSGHSYELGLTATSLNSDGFEQNVPGVDLWDQVTGDTLFSQVSLPVYPGTLILPASHGFRTWISSAFTDSLFDLDPSFYQQIVNIDPASSIPFDGTVADFFQAPGGTAYHYGIHNPNISDDQVIGTLDQDLLSRDFMLRFVHPDQGQFATHFYGSTNRYYLHDTSGYIPPSTSWTDTNGVFHDTSMTVRNERVPFEIWDLETGEQINAYIWMYKHRFTSSLAAMFPGHVDGEPMWRMAYLNSDGDYSMATAVLIGLVHAPYDEGSIYTAADTAAIWMIGIWNGREFDPGDVVRFSIPDPTLPDVDRFQFMPPLPLPMTAISPDTISAGSDDQLIYLAAEGAHFFEGVTVVSITGAGFTIHTTSVLTPEVVSVTVSVADSAISGVRDVFVSTGEETAWSSGGLEVLHGTLGVDQEGVPRVFMLHTPYPNPFNPSLTLRWDSPRQAAQHLVAYDLLGRQVAVLFEGALPAGSHSLTWNAGTLASGIYLIRYEAEDYHKTHKVILLK